MSDGMTTRNRVSWVKTIREYVESEGGAVSPYQMICDYGSYDDAYEIGRVVQMMYNNGDLTFNEKWEMIVSTKLSEDDLNPIKPDKDLAIKGIMG